MAHALIFGASGISGWALLSQLRTYPTSTAFSRITAITNRPYSLQQAQVPQDDRIVIASGVDLRKTPEQVAEAIRSKVSDAETVTHVFFAAYIQEDNYEALSKTNEHLLRAAVCASEQLSSTLKSVVLQTGGKGYGLEFAKQLEVKAPLSEDMPRIPEPYYSKIFYYNQIDLMNELSRGKQWTWTEIRPDGVVGFVPGSNAMNMAQGFGLYLTLQRAVRGKGAVVPYPGHTHGYHAKHGDTFQDILARMEIHTALHPETCGNGQAFNITDAQKPVTWAELWPKLCEHFGLVGSEPSESPQDLGAFVKKHEDVWRAIAKKYGLNEELVAQQGWGHTQYMIVDFDFDRQMDLSKARSAGFKEEIDTAQGYLIAWERMRAAKILPPSEALDSLQSHI
ncbi:hypothetical protein KC349_g8017 [Hortaea werneckii]|nr:hypothetical protein KC349_g8017 [Hortaea werneckii]